MGAGQSTEEFFKSTASYIAFVGACIERKARNVSQFVESEGQKSITLGDATPRTISRKFGSLPTPPLSARKQVDRTDHIVLSARSIAIQKKAPLFRDDSPEENYRCTVPANILRKKLDMSAIEQMIYDDQTNSDSSVGA